MKKLLCFFLSLVLLLSFTACGGDSGNNDEGGSKNPNPNPETPTSSTGEPLVEDLGPWVVTQEIDYRGDRFVYKYNEQGELISYEAFDGTKKYRDYVATHTATANGGKVTVIASKHVQDKEFEKSYEIEYNAKGDMIRYSSYFNDKVTSEYTFSYDAEGYLSAYLYSYEGMLGDIVNRNVIYTYQDGLLRNVEQYVGVEGGKITREKAYSYEYGEDGYLKKIQYTSGEESGTIDLETSTYRDTVTLRLAEGCNHYVPNKNMFIFEEYKNSDGQPGKIEATFNSWGFQPVDAYPYFLMGMVNSVNWQYCTGKLTFTRLAIHLAEQKVE